MATWADFAAAAPEMAARGRDLLYRTGDGEGLLVTVHAGDPPQAHPISVRVVGGGLFAFILKSPKLSDLEDDGRYALHAHFDPAVPHELLLRGRVRPVGGAEREALAKDWSWTVGGAPAFELLIEEALFGERPGPDDWPPKYSTWKAPAISGSAR
jgi:dipeptidyl aminopeptidase/acylaminoacyl peptidase